MFNVKKAIAGFAATATLVTAAPNFANATGWPGEPDCQDSYNLVAQHNTGRDVQTDAPVPFDNLAACIAAICGQGPNGHGYVAGQFGFISADCFNRRTGASDASAAVPITHRGVPIDAPVTYTYLGATLAETPEGCPVKAGGPHCPYRKASSGYSYTPE
ncbi:MAG: hypothetical protein SFW62_03650 [Alphaproteobacteria bacterium]|nr:hypothetical protein [Alphaproteobacteria bacterium]